jgi:hypothetical protein
MVDSAEACTISRSADRKARKTYKCSECGNPIRPGELYRFATFLYDGRWSEDRMCRYCMVAAAWLRAQCGGYLTNGVWEDVLEHVEEFASVAPRVARALKRLDVWRSHHWQIKRGPRAGELIPVPAVPAIVDEKHEGIAA